MTTLNHLFDPELYLHFHQDVLDKDRTKRECDFVLNQTGIGKGCRILDLACGHGRHSKYLAEQGHKVLGIDINESFIEIAQRNYDHSNVEYHVGDILDIAYVREFNLTVLLFNTFGFFSKSQAKRMIKAVDSALIPGGQFILDTRNRDRLMLDVEPCSVMEKGKDLMIDRISYNPRKGTTLNQRIYIKDGIRYDAPFTMYHYNYSDLMDLIEGTSLVVKSCYGGWNGEEFSESSKRILLLLEKT